ncbi:ATP-grasp domain-containing protein [Fructobacillus sp. M1-13]|uniref:carbamoyl-phosphate synthase (ammonia) n=1 Tax=Fructobacillus papyriferae TaxID=2713171 RepID=A0ABS5QNS7_9LACO|nr:ATP-grasp domain-containing protein [Fructobacillus papyriferae]MBS9334795.1 ATP-grasp domain-containing protein [Fructobacillus papyriferae]MCD2158785.1 ATP-grasp domain-containing protein [Fructobacillus papyriferae]
MYKKTTKNQHQRLLFLGAGETDFGMQGENDAAIYQVLPILEKQGYQLFLVDDNPYSLALESGQAQTIVATLTVQNVKAIIKEQQIDGVFPGFAGDRGLRLWQQVMAEWREEDGPRPVGLGIPDSTVDLMNDSAALFDRLSLSGLAMPQATIVRSQAEANELLRDLELPLLVRAHHPAQATTRKIVKRLDDFENAVDQVIEQSLTKEVVISKAINGLKEVSLLVLRDAAGNCLQIGASEDMDPVGIHTSDSLTVAPTLTISDQVLQEMRTQAFQVANLLNIQGPVHVQLALDEKTGRLYIIKVSPYLDYLSNRMALLTGYPVMLVAAQLATGRLIQEIELPDSYHEKTAMMEPVMDHIVVKLPVFSFGDLKASGVRVNRQLNSIQKSVGSALGFGRTFIEAMEKAIRAAHFNNRSFSPKYMKKLSDDEMIQQLIHPHDNRVLLLLEALRRGYEIDELAELTKIDGFYFYQLKQLLAIEAHILDGEPSRQLLNKAKSSGLSDGLLARFWDSDFQAIRELAKQAGVVPTYKALEPSAGEFPENAHQFFATFEEENESVPVSNKTILVIGPGAFRMGDGASAGYVTAVVLSELRALGYKTVIMNNNASDASLLPHLSDKQYLEPLEVSDVMSVVDQEQPEAIVVPGNRRKLIEALTALGQKVIVLPKEKHQPMGPEEGESEFALNIFYDGARAFPLVLTQHQSGEIRLIDQDESQVDLSGIRLPYSGVYQLIWREKTRKWLDQVRLPDFGSDTWLRPMPYGQIAFLSKILQLSLIRLVVRSWKGGLDEDDLDALVAHMPALRGADFAMVSNRTDFDLHLKPDQPVDSTRYEMGAKIMRLMED